MKTIVWKAGLSLILLCTCVNLTTAQDLQEDRRKAKKSKGAKVYTYPQPEDPPAPPKPPAPPTPPAPPAPPTPPQDDRKAYGPLNVDSLFQSLEARLNGLSANSPESRKALSEAREQLAKARRKAEVRRYEIETQGDQDDLKVELRTDVRKALADAQKAIEAQAEDEEDDEARKMLEEAADEVERANERLSEELKAMGADGDSASLSINVDGNGMSIRINKDKDDDEKGGPDSTRKYKIVNTGLAGFNIGLNTWTNEGQFNLTGSLNDLELKQPNSVEYTLLLFPTRIRLGHRSKFHLLTSANILWQNYKFREPVTLTAKSNEFGYTVDNDRSFIRNKLAMSYIQVPLQLMFSTDRKRPREGFRVAFGPYVAYQMTSHTKQREAGKDRVKVKDDFNLDRLQYGLGGRIGYKWLELYTNYGLTDLFEESSGAPSLRSFSVGIRLI